MKVFKCTLSLSVQKFPVGTLVFVNRMSCWTARRWSCVNARDTLAGASVNSPTQFARSLTASTGRVASRGECVRARTPLSTLHRTAAGCIAQVTTNTSHVTIKTKHFIFVRKIELQSQYILHKFCFLVDFNILIRNYMSTETLGNMNFVTFV